MRCTHDDLPVAIEDDSLPTYCGQHFKYIVSCLVRCIAAAIELVIDAAFTIEAHRFADVCLRHLAIALVHAQFDPIHVFHKSPHRYIELLPSIQQYHLTPISGTGKRWHVDADHKNPARGRAVGCSVVFKTVMLVVRIQWRAFLVLSPSVSTSFVLPGLCLPCCQCRCACQSRFPPGSLRLSYR